MFNGKIHYFYGHFQKLCNKLPEGNEHVGMGQNPIPLVNIKIAGKWMFIPLKMVCIGIDPYPHLSSLGNEHVNNPQFWELKKNHHKSQKTRISRSKKDISSNPGGSRVGFSVGFDHAA